MQVQSTLDHINRVIAASNKGDADTALELLGATLPHHSAALRQPEVRDAANTLTFLAAAYDQYEIANSLAEQLWSNEDSIHLRHEINESLAAREHDEIAPRLRSWLVDRFYILAHQSSGDIAQAVFSLVNRVGALNDELNARFRALNNIGRLYSPVYKRVSDDDLKKLLQEHCTPGATFLDCGGRDGKSAHFAEGYDYTVLDFDASVTLEGAVIADICNCPQVPSNSFDVVFSRDLLEHVKEPWNAASEMVRIAKPNGLVMSLSPFSWRYHPFPEDYFRFSHSGLALLFERTGNVERLNCGYNWDYRRKSARGGHRGWMPGFVDAPPVDELGGWREQWVAIYAGRKT